MHEKTQRESLDTNEPSYTLIECKKKILGHAEQKLSDSKASLPKKPRIIEQLVSIKIECTEQCRQYLLTGQNAALRCCNSVLGISHKTKDLVWLKCRLANNIWGKKNQ